MRFAWRFGIVGRCSGRGLYPVSLGNRCCVKLGIDECSGDAHCPAGRPREPRNGLEKASKPRVFMGFHFFPPCFFTFFMVFHGKYWIFKDFHGFLFGISRLPPKLRSSRDRWAIPTSTAPSTCPSTRYSPRSTRCSSSSATTSRTSSTTTTWWKCTRQALWLGAGKAKRELRFGAHRLQELSILDAHAARLKRAAGGD